MPVLPFSEELFELLEVEFNNTISIFLLICLMLYTNNKYNKNYILQAFWLITISWFIVSLMDDNFIVFPTIMLSFNAIINISYLTFGLQRK